ncbi:SDR family NAD(P)-dependent oxidoreductase [Ideonella sp. A 288]|uniref:SDR family NAD(P)-dependent oxidoreductase n=1 Tax=Ideonella sp. A 288 TaxID=1962181 RepID=UPI000B4B7270|nr:SDR family oxidoreductase [Ideonella sp. A 288]
MTDRLQGKVAVITGAASGIGLATLERFVAEGARVLAADIQDEAGQALQARFPQAVCYRHCDVSQPPQIQAAIDSAVAQFGGLDILFSNAGRVGTTRGVHDWDADAWDATQAVLLRSVVAGASYATPHMVRRGGGSIINTSSISALQAGFAPIAYSVAKAGVLHFTRLAAAELSAHRIRINALVPGFIATSIFGRAFGLDTEQSAAMAQAVAERSGTANPIGRSGLPTDIAEAALFLASDASGFVTGTHLTVDGGLTIGPRHSWDTQTPGPMAAALALSPEQMAALRAGAPR